MRDPMMRGIARPAGKAPSGPRSSTRRSSAAVRLSHRYIPARQLPDKAVSLLDTACARVAMSQQRGAGRRSRTARAASALRHRAGASSPANDSDSASSASERIAADCDAEIARSKSRAWPGWKRAGAPRRRWSIAAAESCARHCATADACGRRGEGRRARRRATNASTSDEVRRLQARSLRRSQGETEPLILPSVDEQAVAAVVATGPASRSAAWSRTRSQTVLNLAGDAGPARHRPGPCAGR